jgi:hypothetical protein
MSLPSECSWIKDPNIRPYVFIRKDNRVKEPGAFLKDCDWFSHLNVLNRDPLSMTEEPFGRLILELEGRAFHQSGMPMPGWVFYDCGLIPGVVAGFAYKTEKLPEVIRKTFGESLLKTDWTPLSLFIAIPCVNKNEWVAHNLSSINALLPNKEDRFYGLGFLTKAFGLWYENIEKLCGMTQWESPALKLHANYGDFEVLTAYTPIHSHAKTMTYRCSLDFKAWQRFFKNEENPEFAKRYEKLNDFSLIPTDRNSLVDFQKRIEDSDEAYFLKPDQIRRGIQRDPVDVYRER